MSNQHPQNHDNAAPDVRATLLAVRSKLREALALSLRRRGRS